MTKIGIIGGSGLDDPNILQEVEEKKIDTPYGQPSSSLKVGKINGVDVVLLARHGRDHTIPPTQVNFRANIHALKKEGCTHILSSTAVGSLREEIHPADLVILDQFIDFTKHRLSSFHEKFAPHKPIHTPMAEPFCNQLRSLLIQGCEKLNLRHHQRGTVITIEGPRFSTKAESHMFRLWGADVINMSVATEAALSNEAGIPYAAIAMSTDYDCWKEDEEPVTWEAILEIFKKNSANVTDLLINTIASMKNDNHCDERHRIIKEKIRTVPHWPKFGIMFRDITTLLKDAKSFSLLMDVMCERYKNMDIDVIVGIESRGFIIGSILADRLNKGFVPIRKAGKLPAEKESEEYQLEYGTDKVEIHKDAITNGDKVLLVDDLIATGGTALASCNLIKKIGGDIVECSFVVDLPDVGGKKRLQDAGYKVYNVVEFEGE